MSTRIGIDIGGTFTDLVYYDEKTQQVALDKVPTNAVHPDVACIQAVSQTLSAEQLRDAGFFLHGTTVGLNAIIERKGASVGLLTTKGFRDILEIRRYEKDDPYDLFASRPFSLVPRRLCRTIKERMNFQGNVLTPIDENEVAEACVCFMEMGVESIAVSFLHSYANPDHELAAEAALRASGFKGDITLSHRISGEIREYERTSSTVISAYVVRKMDNYLTALEEGLRDKGFSGKAMITRSGGGAMTFADARKRAFESINSGPVAGAEGAAELSRKLGLGDLIVIDVGGTSTDTCLIRNGSTELMYEGSVENLPVQGDWVDVRSIGAGGGSIIYPDEGGLLQVGPRSAGSMPGPVCYSRGGTEPTLTDAAAILGMFGDGKFSDTLQLDIEKAKKALQPIADKLGHSLQDTARGVLLVATSSMANAIQEITVERGLDPRAMELFPIGGAGPLMATLLVRELGIQGICIPRYAGNFSAWGLLGADVVKSRSRTAIKPLNEQSITALGDIASELFAEIEGDGPDIPHDTVQEVTLDMRYIGQQHSLSISVQFSGNAIQEEAAALHQKFEEAFKQIYFEAMPLPVEISSVRVYARECLPERVEKFDSTSSAQVKGTFPAFSFTKNQICEFAIVTREALPAGEVVEGPAIIKEKTTTTYLDAGYQALIGKSGLIEITSTGDFK